MTSIRSDEERQLSLLANADRHLGEMVVSGIGAIGGTTICSIIGGAMAFPFGPPGFFFAAVPGAFLGGFMGGAIGNFVAKSLTTRDGNVQQY